MGSLENRLDAVESDVGREYKKYVSIPARAPGVGTAVVDILCEDG